MRDANRRLTVGRGLRLPRRSRRRYLPPHVSVPQLSTAASGAARTSQHTASPRSTATPWTPRSQPIAESGVQDGAYLPQLDAAGAVPVARLTSSVHAAVAPLRKLLAGRLAGGGPADASGRSAQGPIRRLRGVADAELLDAARLELDGRFVAGARR